MKHLLLVAALTVGVLALMYGSASAFTLTFSDTKGHSIGDRH